MALALVALARPAFVHLRYGSVPWTAWALPALIICNLAVTRATVTRAASTRPQLVRVWAALVLVATLAMIASLVEPMLRR